MRKSNKDRGFSGLVNLVTEDSLIESHLQTKHLEKQSHYPEPAQGQTEEFPLIELIKYPTMPAPWDSSDAGESWIWGPYFFIFQKQPLTILEKTAEIQGGDVKQSVIKYRYAMLAFYHLDKNPHGPSQRPIFALGIEESDTKALAKEMGVDLSDLGADTDKSVMVGLFSGDSRDNLGRYEGELNKKSARDFFFETYRGLLGLSGQPEKLGTLKTAHGTSSTGLPKKSNTEAKKKNDNEESGGASFFWILVVFTLLIVFGFIASQKGAPKNSSLAPKYSSSETSSHSQPEKKKYEPKRPVESKPPYGNNQVLAISQIRWCLAQKIRLDASEATIDRYNQSHIDKFNSLVKDFNGRCGAYRYRKGNLSSAKTSIKPYRAIIRSEGEAIFKADNMLK